MNEKIFSEGNLFNLNRIKFFQMLSVVMRYEETHFLSKETEDKHCKAMDFLRENAGQIEQFEVREEIEEKLWNCVLSAGEDGFTAGFRFAYSLISTMTK